MHDKHIYIKVETTADRGSDCKNSDHPGWHGGRNQQKSSVPLFSDLYELFAKGIFVPVQDQAGMQAFIGD